MEGKTARERADEFLRICDEFRLGELVTEQSHAVTANLSEVARDDTAAALDLLFGVDGDVVAKYRAWAESGRSEEIAGTVTDALMAGGRIFFTGCGATGRLSILLDSIWRDFWQQRAVLGRDLKSRPIDETPSPLTGEGRGEGETAWENRTISIMAGGDYALIKSVEGFEDITAFGRRQISEHNVGQGDIVFAITEGGETSWVIGTAWEALERGAKVYFVYNNPDDILREHVQRSREIIEDSRIEKINLTTGPMAITGSTRMQATSIQLCVMLTIMEMALRQILNRENASFDGAQDAEKHEKGDVPLAFLAALEEVHATLRSESVLRQLAKLVEMEEGAYRGGGKTNYFAESLALDALTDTTERSPTFCTPPFRKCDDPNASESWVYLFTRPEKSEDAWRAMLKRKPRAVEWTKDQLTELVPTQEVERRHEVIERISLAEIHKFKIGMEGAKYRRLGSTDAAVEIIAGDDRGFSDELHEAHAAGARTAVIRIGGSDSTSDSADLRVEVPLPETGFLLNGIAHVAAKLLLNALSTCVMVRLGRVMGNYMIYVVPSNLKLIDRATRYISKLADIPYEDACRLLFEIIEYVEPRMEANQVYPPVVGMAVMRAKDGISNEEAEARISSANAA